LDIKTLRTFTQGVVLVAALLIPVFDIFRFDVSVLKLYLFRQEWSFAPQGDYLSGVGGDPADFIFKGIIPIILLFTTLPVCGAILGRFLCGWFCPVGAIFEIADFYKRKLAVFRRFYLNWRSDGEIADLKDLLYGSLTVLSIVVTLLVMGIFFAGLIINPAEIWRQISSLEFSSFFIIAALGIMAFIVVIYFARIAFCSYICLIGITQMVPFLVSPISLRIRFNKDMASMCTNCRSCERVCFMGIKPRTMKNKVNPKCINCGECITVCKKELGKKNGLFSFGFGVGKRQAKKVARKDVITGNLSH